MNKIIDCREINTVHFDDLKVGDCFMSDNEVYIKVKIRGCYYAVGLTEGSCYESFSWSTVQKVDVAISCYNAIK